MKSDPIFELEQKIIFLAETLKEVGKCTSVSIDGFAKATNISRERLRSAIAAGSVTDDLETAICKAGNFSASDLTWKDTRIDFRKRMSVPRGQRYPGLDTADNFRRRVRQIFRLPVLGNLTLRTSRPILTKKNLAALSVTAGQTGVEDVSVPLIFQLTMNPGFHASGFSYGFRRVRLTFDFADDSNIRLVKRLGEAKRAELSKATIDCAANEFDSYWYVRSQGGLLIGDFVTGDAPLCEILDAAVDEQFSAIISVCPPDGDLVFSAESPSTNGAQKAVLKALMAEKIPGAQSADGWIVLGKQTLTVTRG